MSKTKRTERLRLTKYEAMLIQAVRNDEVNNVLVIGDLHSPFIKENYLYHCMEVYYKYNCNEVVFIGDIIDNHYSSFHPSDPDGYGAGEELERATDSLKDWYKAFPIAKVMLGNHDRIPARKAFDAGISEKWMANYSDVLGVPNWTFQDSYVKDDVKYVHGDGSGHAVARSRKELISIVQGHFHSKAYIDYTVGANFKIFGMQVGCGVNDKAYAMAYGKNHPKSAISCGVVLNNGTLPIIEMMKL